MKRPGKWAKLRNAHAGLSEICTQWNATVLNFFFAPPTTAPKQEVQKKSRVVDVCKVANILSEAAKLTQTLPASYPFA